MSRSLHIREDVFKYSRVPARGPAAETMAYGWTMWARRCRTAVEAALPDTCAELYFNLGPTGRHLVSPDATRESASHRAAWVVGPHARVLLLAKELADSDIVGVRLQPGAVAQLLGAPAAELREQVVDLDHFWGADVERLREQLFERRHAAQRVSLLEQEIARRTNTSGREHACMRVLRNAIENAGGDDASIGRSAMQFGLSHRRVISLFDRYVGLKPKEYQRVHRLRTVLSRLDSRARFSWAGVAYEVGYCDQAHLANEFRRLAGLTLTDYAARRSPVGEGVYRYRVVPTP